MMLIWVGSGTVPCQAPDEHLDGTLGFERKSSGEDLGVKHRAATAPSACPARCLCLLLTPHQLAQSQENDHIPNYLHTHYGKQKQPETSHKQATLFEA